MTKVSELGPLIPGKLHDGQVVREEDHFYSCPSCGQKVDKRDLRQCLLARRAGEPLEPEPEAKVIKFPRRK